MSDSEPLTFDILSLVKEKVDLGVTLLDERTQDLSLDITHRDYTTKGFAISTLRLYLSVQDLDRLSNFIYDIQQKLAMAKMKEFVKTTEDVAVKNV